MLNTNQSPLDNVPNGESGVNQQQSRIRKDELVIWSSKGKVCGKFKNGTYYKSIDFRRHILYCLGGGGSIGIDSAIIEKLNVCNCRKVEVKDKNSGKLYWVEFSPFCERSIRKDFHRGDGMQCFLQLPFWNNSDNPQPELFPESLKVV